MSSASAERREIRIPAPLAPPCDRCAFARVCREQQLACHAFLVYCDAAHEPRSPRTSRLPSRAIFAALFGGDAADIAAARRAAGLRGAARRRELQAGDDSLHRYADRIKARAIRRGGELLKRIKPANGANQNIRAGAGPKVPTRALVAQAAGLSDRQKKTMLRVANVPAEMPPRSGGTNRPFAIRTESVRTYLLPRFRF